MTAAAGAQIAARGAAFGTRGARGAGQGAGPEQGAVGHLKTLSTGYLQYKAIDNAPTRYYVVPASTSDLPISLEADAAPVCLSDAKIP